MGGKLKAMFEIPPGTIIPACSIIAIIIIAFTRVEDTANTATDRGNEDRVDADVKWALQRHRDEKQDIKAEERLLAQQVADKEQDIKSDERLLARQLADKEQLELIAANRENNLRREGELAMILSGMEGFKEILAGQSKELKNVTVELSRLDGETSAVSGTQKK